MHPTITIPVLGLLLIFLAGLAVGWLMGRVRLQGRFNVSLEKPNVPGSIRTVTFKKTDLTLNLKCQCGTTWKFHETSDHADQGSQSMPTGDSFICPKCGRSIDLREFHKIQPEIK